MRIDGWSIGAFGPIDQWTVSGLAENDVVVVLGPNESGKSALFEFFASSLFGFSPATAEAHPYRPWDGRFLEGRLDLELSGGEQIRVARRLTSRPEGRIIHAQAEERLANRPISPVGLMTRDVFKNVYALTQEEALGLDARAWQHVQDRVLGGSSYDFLRPSREVVNTLDSERRRLWRPDRRGRPRAREIATEIRGMRDGLREAAQRRSQIEAIDERLEKIAAALGDNTRKLQRIELSLERDATLAPLVGRVERMGHLNAQADDLLPEGVLPDDIPDRRGALVARLEELRESRETHVREIEAREAVTKIDEPTGRLLEARAAIERQDRELALARADQDRIASMNAELQRRDGAQREVAVRALVSEVLDSDARDAILGLSVAELRGRLRASSDARRSFDAASEAARATESERERLEEVLAASEATPGRAELDERLQALREVEAVRRVEAERPATRRSLPTPLPVVIALIGVALLGLGLGVYLLGLGLGVGGVIGSVLAIVGAAAAVAAVVLTLTRAPTSGAADLDAKARLRELDLGPTVDISSELTRTQGLRDAAIRRELDAERVTQAQEAATQAGETARTAEAVYHAARAGFLGVIANVPVAPIHREAPSDGLVRDLEEMRQSIQDTMRMTRNRNEVAERLTAWRADVEGLRQTLDIESPADPFEAAPAARRALEAALDTERAASEAAAELSEIRQRLESSDQERDGAMLELERIDTSLAALDPDAADPVVGLERLQQARELRAEARRILADLEREMPGWRERVSEADALLATGESIDLSDAERVDHRLRAEELRGTGQDLAAEKGQLTTERDRLSAEPGPAHIMGAIQAAEEQLAFVQREHDRLALLRQVVLMAEHSFRERYQAPLLTAAGRHLRHFTGGRYDLLTVDDASSRDVKLQVRRTGEDFPQDVDTPLSRGTIQQIYFALRLAMVDLVEGDEPLPLFLDEMFVNWDPGRTTSGLAALADMPGDRQVFLFTADPFWAERAVQDVPAHIVRTPAG
ncbi:MAG: AAA family ATPase [Chloroflexota bacterium]|nr:AAA family ATPase [Chloroflexota bacterium]